MSAKERRERTIRLARERNDRGAVAILEADRTWSPEPEPRPVILLPGVGVRWSRAA